MYTLAVKSGILKCEGAGDIEEDGAICIFLVGEGGERQGRDERRERKKRESFSRGKEWDQGQEHLLNERSKKIDVESRIRTTK